MEEVPRLIRKDQISEYHFREFERRHSFVHPEGCWEWLGHITNRGYGIFFIFDRKFLAHRISYVLYVGELRKGMVICHTCDNPKCVNPFHLFQGTMKDNSMDMSKKGRWKNQFMNRTVCSKGHPLIAGNLKLSPSIKPGRLICRTCNLQWRRENRKKKNICQKNN